MISLGYNSVGNPLPGAGLGKEVLANAGVMVSQEIPAPGKLKLKGEMASKEAQAEFEQYQAVQLDVVKAQTQTSILETRLVKLERERSSREAEIDSILNRAARTPVGRPEDVKPKELTATLEDLFTAARQNSPMLGRDRKMIERSELAVNMARKEYYPDVTLNAGYYYMGSMPPMYEVRADVKVPIYFWRKQRAGVNEQVSSLSQVRRTYESTDQALRYRIQDDFLMAQASARLMKLYTQTVVPQGNLALESSLSTYETGSVDFLSVLSNFTMVLDYEMNYYDEAMNYALALSRLEQMTGQALTD